MISFNTVEIDEYMIDITSYKDKFELETINCFCPLCDNPFDEDDKIVIVKQNDLIGLAHRFCIENFIEVDGVIYEN